MPYPTTDTPNIYLASETPDLPEMRRQLSSAIAGASEWYERAQHCLNVRYCWWEGQHRDGRKYGSEQRPPFPWKGASDTRIRAVEMVIQEQVGLCLTSLDRMNIQVTPTKAGGIDLANRMSTLLRWYISNAMADEGDAEIEPLANYMLTLGSAVLGVNWLQRREYEMKTVRLEELEQMALAAGGPPMLAQIGAILWDPARREQALAFVRSSSPMLSNREAAGVLQDLRMKGTATFPRPYVAEARPCLTALQTFQDVYFPPNTVRLQRARWIAQRELLSETELRERALADDWDEEFVDDLLTSYKGKQFDATNHAAMQMREFQREMGGVWSEAGEEAAEMYEVWHLYHRAAREGIPAIFRTVFSPLCDTYHGKHEVMPYLHGQYPFVEFVRERHDRTILSSRGLPEVLDTQQSEIKVQRDARTDRASLTTLPPMKVKYRPGMQKHTFGPGVEIPVNKMDDIEPMGMGAPDMTSIEVERASKRDMNEYAGRPDSDLDPQLATDRKQGIVRLWLARWKIAGRQILQLAQQYTPEMTIPKVVGLIPQPVDISRDAISGQFDMVLSFDARFAQQDFMFSLLERLEKYVLPMDTNAIVNRDALIRFVMSGIDPTLADLVVRDSNAAQMIEVEDEQTNLAKMYAGVSPPMKLQGQNFAARLQVLQDALQRNPYLQQALQQRPDFKELVTQRAEFLQQQVSQQQNRMIGVYGTAPSPGSQGGPQIGAFGPSNGSAGASGGGAGGGTPQMGGVQ